MSKSIFNLPVKKGWSKIPICEMDQDYVQLLKNSTNIGFSNKIYYKLQKPYIAGKTTYEAIEFIENRMKEFFLYRERGYYIMDYYQYLKFLMEPKYTIKAFEKEEDELFLDAINEEYYEEDLINDYDEEEEYYDMYDDMYDDETDVSYYSDKEDLSDWDSDN